jgi:DHA2 family multidrug resistance protein
VATPYAAEAHTSFERALILTIVVFAGAVYASTQTIILVSLPQMQGDLSASIDQISWVVTANIVASAIGIPPTAWLSARFGRKRLFLFCIGLFIASCLLLSISTTLEEVVLWRIMQGLSGAPLIAITQAIALDIYPRERQGMAMAVWSVGLIVGPVAAPAVGGYLTEIGDWRLVFLAMVPLAVFSFFASLAYVPEWPTERRLRFDWFGFVAVTMGIGAAQLTIDQGQRLDWFDSTEIILLTVIAGSGLYIFITHILTARNPFLDSGIFKDRNFSVGLIAMFFYSPLIYIPMVLMPNMLEDLRDFPALTIGLLLLPRGLGQIVGLSLAGRIVGKVDCRKLLVISLILQAFTTWAMSQWDLGIGIWDIVWPNVLQGIAMGFIFMSIITITYSTLAQERRTEAAALFSLVRNFGTSVGISVAVTLFVRFATQSRATLIENAAPFNELFRLPENLSFWDLQSLASIATLNSQIVRHAQMVGYANDFFVMTVWALALIPLALFARNSMVGPR